MSLFSERIRTRQRVWWGSPNRWHNPESYRRLFHRLKEHLVLRDKDDPEDQWRCCEFWQRTLINKWNAREFAQRYGCRVPTLYWFGRHAGALPLDSLPTHFVIRQVWGSARKGVYVFAHDRELLRERTFTKYELKTAMRQNQGWIPRVPILIEEFLKTEAGDYALPIEYKFYTFGATIGAIQVVQRTGLKVRKRFYTASWEPFDDPMNTYLPQADPIDPPRCFDEMVACAKRLGAALGTFIRVDLYATDKGCVFGEFSSTPLNGQYCTTFADEYFGKLWDDVCPDRT